MSSRQGQWRRRMLVLVLVILTGGCELFVDYDDIGRGIDPVDATDVPDRDMVVDASTDTDRDATDAANSSDADADVGVVQCPLGEPSYVIRPASELVGEPAVDANCEEFSAIAPLPIPPANTLDGNPINTSDNDVDCRIVWLETTSTRIHGCCRVTDDSLMAAATTDDPIDAMTQNPDDRIEYNFKCDLDRSTFACTRKHFINALAPDPTVVERTYRTRNDRDESFADQVDARATETANGFVLEWEAELGFQAAANHRGLCSLALFDNDQGEEQTRAYAFGPINDIQDWACCQFAE